MNGPVDPEESNLAPIQKTPMMIMKTKRYIPIEESSELDLIR